MNYNTLMLIFVILLTIPGCATFNDPNDQIIHEECALKNSIPDIHDEVI
jgi:hypothetical protein